MEQTQQLQQRLQELGDFLRTRRTRLDPDEIALPRKKRRRTTGLTQAEVAQLANISTEWYSWLEQGRPIRTSLQVLESLAQVLHLDDNERSHLFLLAHHQSFVDSVIEPEIVSPELQYFLDQLGNTPAFVMGKFWDVVAWNTAACELICDYRVLRTPERNSIWGFFTSPTMRQYFVDWEILGRWMVADFRASCARYLGDARLTALIEDLMQHSLEFRTWWTEHEIFDFPLGRRVVNHPVLGTLVFNHTAFQLRYAESFSVTVFTPMDECDTSARVARFLSEQESKGSGQNEGMRSAQQTSTRFCVGSAVQRQAQSGERESQIPMVVRADIRTSEHDLIGQWLNECCEMPDDAWTDNASIMVSYIRWCQYHGYEPQKARGFVQALAARGFEISVLGWRRDAPGKRTKARGIRGLSLRADGLFLTQIGTDH
jgi:transcriptional regulator with XRE-family HTH domain